MTLLRETSDGPQISPRLPTPPRRASLAVGIVLLIMATIHCATSIFYVNYSYLDLKAYAAGTERMPYQGRIGMMPVIQLAERSHGLTALSARIQKSLGSTHKHSAFGTMTPEELACMIAGIVSLLLSVGIASAYGLKRFPAIWWMPPTLLLAMLYITQAARYETTLWYPYDLPHIALFGAACLLIMEGAWLPVLLLFLIDLPVRETAIFLVCVCVTVGWARGQLKQALLVSGLMFAAWIPFRIYVRHRFAANVNELGAHYTIGLLNPIHWPQVASAFGFLLIPMCLGNRRLSKPQRAFMLGALPCLLVTLAFGVWPETRIFGEWLLPAAVLLTAEIYQRFPPREAIL